MTHPIASTPAMDAMTDAARLFDEVLEHTRLCTQDPDTISDHWAHTLDQRSSVYTLGDMFGMLEPGNPVNARIRYMAYLIDATAVDTGDPVQARLLALGESDVGRPRREIPAGDGCYSSAFLNTVACAGNVIGAIDRAGIKNPRIMEIGGGLGLLAGAIRAYYGDRATLYCVDIPEMLMIQEWYLRSRFPEAATAFLPTSKTASLVTGGINFINAYDLAGTEIPIDAAVNINAMQDMKATVAGQYIKYVEENISGGGVFYFQNTTGQSTSSAPEPSEYGFGPHWSVCSIDIANQIETCMPSEELRVVLAHTQRPEDPVARRLALRLIWNGTMAGDLPPASGGLGALFRLSQQSGTEQLHTVEGLGITRAEIDALSSGPHFPQESFRKPFANLSSTAATGTPMPWMWNAQAQLVDLMRRAAGEEPVLTGPEVAGAIESLCHETNRGMVSEAFPDSEYWAAYIASFLLPLGARDAARERLSRITDNSHCAAWLIRFAHLFAAYGFTKEAMDTLAKIKQCSSDDSAIVLKGAEIEHICGKGDLARETLARLAHSDNLSSTLAPVLAKTAARLGHADIVQDVCTMIADNGVSEEATLLDVLWFAASGLSVKAIRDILNVIAKRFPLGASSPSMAATYGGLLMRLGREDEGSSLLDQAINDFNDDYFRQGWLGRMFQELGNDGRADACFARSLEIRPGNFMHYEFIGNVYFAAGRWRMAVEKFEHAAALKPYLRYLQGRAAYCRMPKEVRDSGCFGRPHELDMIFQLTQSYYHDIGL